MAEVAYVKEDDTRPWTFLFTSDSESDFTDVASAVIYMRLETGGANKINGSALVIGTTTTANAPATYSPVAGDVDTAGIYLAYCVVTFTTGSKTGRFPSKDFDKIIIQANYE